MSASETGAASESTPMLPDEYGGLIERVRETANAIIPRNATVLVVSRGDEELVHIGPRRALHFPQDEFGSYAGYHPHDSDEAIAVLESMRARGAEYLLLPNPSFWWLDYYEGFRDHLERNYSQIVSADDCVVYELAATGLQTTPADADIEGVSAATSSPQLAGQLDELLRALLPADAGIAVVTGTTSQLPTFGDCRAASPPSGGADGVDSLRAALEEADAGGAQFLVIPAGSFDHVRGAAEPTAAMGGWGLVTDQRHLCEIYERKAGAEAPAESPQSRDDSSANGERRTAGGHWQRLLGFLRR